MMHDQTSFDLRQQGEPLFILPPLLGRRAIGTGTEAVLSDLRQLRFQQVFQHGHSSAADLQLPLAFLPTEARRATTTVLEDIQFNKRSLMRRHALKAAALLIAFIERLDAEAPQGDPA